MIWRVIILAALCTFAVSACRIDEGKVFLPRDHAARTSPDDLSIRGEDRLEPLVHDVLSLGGERIAVSTLGETVDGPLIVSCFGNASDRRLNGVDYLLKLQPFGQTMVWDYPGYGDSSGAAEVARMESVIAELMPELERRAGARPLVLWGHSLGGFVCAQMAARSDAVDAVILETTAPNVRAVARAWAPLGIGHIVPIQSDLTRFDTPDALADFDGPVLIIGAGRDRVLPVELSRQLAEELPRATYLELLDATHYSAGFDPAAQEAVRAMLAGL